MMKEKSRRATKIVVTFDYNCIHCGYDGEFSITIPPNQNVPWRCLNYDAQCPIWYQVSECPDGLFEIREMPPEKVWGQGMDIENLKKRLPQIHARLAQIDRARGVSRKTMESVVNI